MAETCHAAVFNGDGTYDVREFAVPDPPDGGAVLRVEAVGLCDELVEGVECLVEGRVGVGVVLVVEVDVVGAEPSQAGLAAFVDAAGERAGLVGLVVGAGEELGGDHHVVVA
jgi:hypothetical protein